MIGKCCREHLRLSVVPELTNRKACHPWSWVISPPRDTSVPVHVQALEPRQFAYHGKWFEYDACILMPRYLRRGPIQSCTGRPQPRTLVHYRQPLHHRTTRRSSIDFHETKRKKPYYQFSVVKMAPSRIDSPEMGAPGALSELPTRTKRHTVYLLENFPDEAVAYCRTLFNTVNYTDPEVSRWRENADAILVREKIISAADIESSPKLKAIGKQGTGIDIIDKPAADARGIAICNTPGVNAQSVAELVLALTMGVARELRTISVNQAAGKKVRKEHCSGVMMTGKAIGILGMGAIGTAVANMFKGAFGTTIWAYDPFAPADAWKDIEHTRVADFREMLPHVDMLTLHVPLNETTRGLIGAKELGLMRKDAILINVARGGIVDEVALIKALEEGHLFGAGLDCHDVEPPVLAEHQRLWATGRVVSTPHIGATTKETVVKTATAALDNIRRALKLQG